MVVACCRSYTGRFVVTASLLQHESHQEHSDNHRVAGTCSHWKTMRQSRFAPPISPFQKTQHSHHGGSQDFTVSVSTPWWTGELLSASITLQACDPPWGWFRWQPGMETKNFRRKGLNWGNFTCIYSQVTCNQEASCNITKIFLHPLLSLLPDNRTSPSRGKKVLNFVFLEVNES